MDVPVLAVPQELTDNNTLLTWWTIGTNGECCILNTIITTSTLLLKNIPLTLFERVVCERELETEQNCNILTPTLMAISVVSFSFSRVAQLEARGPALCWVLAFSTTTCLQTLRSPNWLPVFIELYNSSIAHSISPYNWPSECVTSAVLGMTCLIVIARK